MAERVNRTVVSVEPLFEDPEESTYGSESDDTPHSVWDSPVWALGTVTQRVKQSYGRGVLRRREPAGTRPSMPQSSEVWGKGADKCGQRSGV